MINSLSLWMSELLCFLHFFSFQKKEKRKNINKRETNLSNIYVPVYEWYSLSTVYEIVIHFIKQHRLLNRSKCYGIGMQFYQTWLLHHTKILEPFWILMVVTLTLYSSSWLAFATHIKYSEKIMQCSKIFAI